MCGFKSGVILKARCVVAEGENNSHRDLLDSLGIEDTEINAMTKFVRVELLPPNNEWWTDPDDWDINIDQDILPDWYKEDREKYNDEFRKAVKDWCNKHVFVDKKIDTLKEGYYLLKDCDVEVLNNDVLVQLYNTTVQCIAGNAMVQEMYGNATVQKMCGNATVQKMCGNATVQRMHENTMVQCMDGNTTVQKMYGNATVQEIYGNVTVQEMAGNATVQEMYRNATVQRMYENATVQKMYGNAMIQEMYDNSKAFSYKEIPKIKEYISTESQIEVVVHSGGKLYDRERSNRNY